MPQLQQIRRQPDTKNQAMVAGIKGAADSMSRGVTGAAFAQQDEMRHQQQMERGDDNFMMQLAHLAQFSPEAAAGIGKARFGEGRYASEINPMVEQIRLDSAAKSTAKMQADLDKQVKGLVRGYASNFGSAADWPELRWMLASRYDSEKAVLRAMRMLDEEAMALNVITVSELSDEDGYKREYFERNKQPGDGPGQNPWLDGGMKRAAGGGGVKLDPVIAGRQATGPSDDLVRAAASGKSEREIFDMGVYGGGDPAAGAEGGAQPGAAPAASADPMAMATEAMHKAMPKEISTLSPAIQQKARAKATEMIGQGKDPAQAWQQIMDMIAKRMGQQQLKAKGQ